ncbi:8170_t:CDS:2 [Diversispora eburnea]|uniref:8170_t:CDS:1 n=1 Tax=Diversispora eburnea TaxID=1213867 RepID=A0A9N9F4N0_9GLOM|nr:8170_t:CDS:2 [Diversispora eburnea]
MSNLQLLYKAIKDLFEEIPVEEWSYIHFLKLFEPLIMASIDTIKVEDKGTWRKRFITHLEKIIDDDGYSVILVKNPSSVDTFWDDIERKMDCLRRKREVKIKTKEQSPEMNESVQNFVMGGVIQQSSKRLKNNKLELTEKVLLKPLKDNSVKHLNEEALKQAFLDTLIISLHVDIEPEFKVYSQSSSSGKAVDLVNTSTRKRIAIEFDNIKMETLNLSELENVGRMKLMFTIFVEKPESEILNLEINDQHRSQKTVCEVLENKIKMKIEYLMPLII